jgi:hypothetical protein
VPSQFVIKKELPLVSFEGDVKVNLLQQEVGVIV